MNIIKKISAYNNSSRNWTPIKYIVLHYTGNKGDTAENNAAYFGRADRGASAHYFIDDKFIYQVVEENRSAWSVGDGKGKYGITNSNSLNIEMCCGTDGQVTSTTEQNAVELVKMLMDKYDIGIGNVVRHYDASRKNCPNWTESRWQNFKNKLIGQVNNNRNEGYTLLNKVKHQLVANGSRGNHVKLLQSALTVLGYNVNGIDGICGNGCVNAIRQYQRDHGLSADGMCGKDTWTSILTK